MEQKSGVKAKTQIELQKSIKHYGDAVVETLQLTGLNKSEAAGLLTLTLKHVSGDLIKKDLDTQEVFMGRIEMALRIFRIKGIPIGKYLLESVENTQNIENGYSSRPESSFGLFLNGCMRCHGEKNFENLENSIEALKEYRPILEWAVKKSTWRLFEGAEENVKIKKGLDIISDLGVDVEGMFKSEKSYRYGKSGIPFLVSRLEEGDTLDLLSMISDAKEQVRK